MELINIIIVDDDTEAAAFLRSGLSKEAPHFSVATATNGLECLEYIDNNKVDCILSDYQMPVMDGMELLEALRESGINIPFIFITGRGGEEVAREAFKNGAFDYFMRDYGSEYFARITNSVVQAVRRKRAEEMKLRAEEELRKKNERLAMLNRINKAVVSTLDLEKIMEILLDNLVRALKMESGAIFLSDPAKDMVEAVRTYNFEPINGPACFRMEVFPMVAEVIKENKPIILNSTACGSPARNIFKILSLALLPLGTSDAVEGVICLHNCEQPHEFSDEEVDFALQVADQAMIAIMNAKMVLSLRQVEHNLIRKNQELAALNSVAAVIASTQDLDTMLDLVLKKTISLSFLNVERKGIIFLRDEEDPQKLNMATHIGISEQMRLAEKTVELGYCLCGKAAQTGKIIKSDDCFEDKDHEFKYPGMRRHGHIILPITSGDNVLGVMNFYLAPGMKATKAEERLLAAIANQLAVAIERYRLFRKLSNDKKEWEKTFDSMGELVTINDADYNILRANRPAAEALGLDIKELIGKNWFDTFVPKDEKVILGAALDRHSSASEYVESVFMDKSGGEKTIAWHITSLRGRHVEGRDTTIICCGEDITERKKLEYQLLQSQKIEAVGQLAGGIAHDFNNITATIVACTNVLQLKMPKDEPLRVYVEQILSSSEKATSLTKSLLSFSRKQIINPKAVDLNEIVARVSKLLSRLIGEDIELKAKLADEELIVMGDAGQIEQVLMNLVTNARDAMPDGGTIRISTGLVDLDDEFIMANGFGTRGKNALIVFEDTGVGMDEKTKASIFEPFFTTKEVGKGTGLGLSMVYGIVKQHNGYINVYSEPGRGTTFRVYIPVIRTMANDLETITLAALPRGTETVLLAEDDAALRRITKEVLEGYGYKVIEAVDGKDALDKFLENQDRIQFLILDVVMPRMNGKEAYDAITGVKPGIKALFTSGYMNETISKKGILENSLSFVSKPAPPSELLMKIRESLDK